jgi:hypothetical protein
MATIWEHFESLILAYMESRVAEILTQGDVAPSPKVIAHVRETAAWAADRAVARFMAAERGEGPLKTKNRIFKAPIM